MTARVYPFGSSLVVAADTADERAPLLVLSPDAADPERSAREAALALDRARLAPHRLPRPGTPAALPPVARRRVYALCGRPVAVRFAARAVEALVAPRFAFSERPDLPPVATLTLGRTRRGFVLREADRPDVTAADPVAMSGLFTRRFAELGHGRSDWLAVLHAAAVGDARGALVLPGPNGTGKSTLTAALLARGYGYFSDDCVPIDGRGLVMPMPFALSHKRRIGPVLRLAYQPPPLPSPAPALPRLFLFPRFRTASRPEARRLSPPEALERIVAGRAWLSRRPDDLRRTLALLAATPAWELTYPSTDAALALLAACDRKADAA
jgi:hypothetical protein